MLRLKVLSIIVLFIAISVSCSSDSSNPIATQNDSQNKSAANDDSTIVCIYDPSGEITVLSEKTEKGFLQRYVLQTEKEFPLTVDEIEGKVHFQKGLLKIERQGNSIALALDASKVKEDETKITTIHSGYGLAKHEGVFQLLPKAQRAEAKNADEMIINTLVDSSKTIEQTNTTF